MKKEKERKEKKTVSHHNYKSKYKNNAVFSSLFQLGERAQLSKIDKRFAGEGNTFKISSSCKCILNTTAHKKYSKSWFKSYNKFIILKGKEWLTDE